MRMISREDLKQRVMGHFCGSCSVPYKDADILELGEYCCDIVSDTMAFIEELPTIEAEPVKHGRWIRKNNSFPQRYFCTECGEGDVGRFAFCHHCGVRMDLKDGESE